MQEQDIIKKLIEKKIINIDLKKEIIFASGIKSNIYCDLRKLIGDVEIRSIIIRKMIDLVKKEEFEIVAGTATAGIPWASFIGWELEKPVAYVRSKAKNHGKEVMVEGADVSNQKILLIEDMITTGSSCIKAASELKKMNAKKVFVLSIFNYDFKTAKNSFKEANIEFDSLFKIKLILDYLKTNDLNKYNVISEWIKKIND